jgi:hypothetical protein
MAEHLPGLPPGRGQAEEAVLRQDLRRLKEEADARSAELAALKMRVEEQARALSFAATPSQTAHTAIAALMENAEANWPNDYYLLVKMPWLKEELRQAIVNAILEGQ